MHDEPAPGKKSRTLTRTRAKTGALSRLLRFLRLQANIQFQIFNIYVEALCRLCNLLIGVPFQEGRIRCKKHRIRFEAGLLGDTTCVYV
jgi:hypothetical protein